MAQLDDEEERLRSVALQNAQSILLARQRAEEELVRTREALRESEERLRAIFNQAAVGIAVAGLDGRFVEMNRKFSSILGYSADELRGLTFADITHPDHLARTAAMVDALMSGAIPDYSIEKQYLKKDGSSIWSMSTVTLLRDANGRPQRFIGVIEDISARKQTEAVLLEETRILELLNGTGRTLASQLDLHSLVQAVTDAATQLSGAEFGAFLYDSAENDAFRIEAFSGDFPAPFGDARKGELFFPALRANAPVRCEDTLADPGDRTLPADRHTLPASLPLRSYLAVPVRSRSGAPVGGLIFGHSQPGAFTERSERLVVGVASQAGIAIDNARLYEEAQRAAEERSALLESERAARSAAERMSELKDEFLATLSHELRTPLNAIVGWTQILQRGPKEPADYARGLETIERNARIQTQLIEDLLDMSRITSGKLRLDVQPLPPVSFVEAAIETVQPAADAKGIRLEHVLDPAAGLISGDAARLQQVVWNLLSNAIKFTQKDGAVRITLARQNSHIEITVADTGIGIKPDFIPYLFERFRQGDASTTRLYGGLGLGLSIVKRLVELHGGTVTAASPGEGCGTTVTLQLPLCAVHHHDHFGFHPLPRAGAGGTSPSPLDGVKVLVVDDQSDARDLLRRVLEDAAATVMTAGSAAEAVTLVESERPDVLVSDIGMPGGDGFELLRRVRALGYNRGGSVRAIALTAFARAEDRTRALQAGFLVHVSKPVDASELVATIARIAGRTVSSA